VAVSNELNKWKTGAVMECFLSLQYYSSRSEESH